VLLLVVTIAGGWLATLDAEVPLTTGVVLLVLGGWSVSLCLHEFGHAVIAYRGGDRTVAEKGYLTLDIRRYAVPGLTFVLPVFFLLAGGVPLPGGAVWINHWMIRSRPVRSLVSLAGPLMNLILSVLLVVVTRAVPMATGLLIGLSYLALVQLLAFILNILPIPGLDGWGVIEPYLSDQARAMGDRARQWVPVILLLVLLSVPQLSQPFFDLGWRVFGGIGGSGQAAELGYSQFMFWRH
jgi:Zn-dependent protease